MIYNLMRLLAAARGLKMQQQKVMLLKVKTILIEFFVD